MLLLAEDHSAVRDLITDALVCAGYEVLATIDGGEALHVFQHNRERVALTVLDIDMPKRNGISCLCSMRRSRPDMPAVIVSGLLEVDSRQIPEGVTLLQKPFEIGDLTRSVSEALNRAP